MSNILRPNVYLPEKQITAVCGKTKKNPEIHLDKDRSEVEEQRGSAEQNNGNQTDCRCRPEFCSMERSLGETRRMEKKKREKSRATGRTKRGTWIR